MVAVVIKSIFFKDFIDDGSICGVGSGGGVTIGFGGSFIVHHHQHHHDHHHHHLDHHLHHTSNTYL